MNGVDSVYDMIISISRDNVDQFISMVINLDDEHINKLFIELASRGEINLANEIFTRNNKLNLADAFIAATLNNQLDIAKWLITIDKKIVDTKTLENLFIKSYKSNNINMARWLYKLIPVKDADEIKFISLIKKMNGNKKIIDEFVSIAKNLTE